MTIQTSTTPLKSESANTPPMVEGDSSAILVEARRLTKRFGNVEALVDLDLQIGGGEVLCLLGANGAGKTTTINLFLGFHEPTSGEALIDGLDVSRDALSVRRRLAYIPEQVALYPRLSGLENLQFFAELSGHSHPQSELESYLSQAGLEGDAIERRAGGYSKGMRQKVGIAVALAKGASVLLLDEPLSGLDPKAANAFCAQIEEMKSQGCAVLMATHDLFRAREVGTKVGIMRQGRLMDLIDASGLELAELESIYLEHMHDLEGSST